MTNSFIKCMATLFVFTQLTACDSGVNGQIEKCVQAAIAANGPYKTSTEKSEMEFISRTYCLKAASGKE
jgi:hypothetical protein